MPMLKLSGVAAGRGRTAHSTMVCSQAAPFGGPGKTLKCK